MALILPTITIPTIAIPTVTIPTIAIPTVTIPTVTLPISTTMISCVSNPLMIGLNVVKGALSDNLTGLAIAPDAKARLAIIKKIGEDIKGKLKTMILLQLPVVPNFKSEYAILLASVNNQIDFAKNALALEKKWGKALGIAVIRGLLDNIGSIDLCKGIPNIDGKLQADGTVTAIPKAQLAPIPAAPPAAHVPLTPTVQNAVTAPTSGNSGVTKDEYNKYLRKTNSILDGVEDPIIKKANDQARAIMALNKTALHVNLVKKFKAANVSSPEEYEKIRKFTPAEIDFFEKRSKHFQLNLGLRLMIQVIKTTWYQHELYIASEISKEEYDTWYNECITDIKDGYELGNVVELVSMAMNAIASLIKQLDANKDIIIKGHQYENNTK